MREMDRGQEYLDNLLERVDGEARSMLEHSDTQGRAIVHTLYGHGVAFQQIVSRLRDIEEATKASQKSQNETIRELKRLTGLVTTGGIIIIAILLSSFYYKIH
jgi:hypothetical protein